MKFILSIVLTLLAAQSRPQPSRWWSHVEALANDGMEGRNTGTPGHKRAAEYVAQQFQKAGLEPAGLGGYIQPVAFKTRRIVEAESSLALVSNGKTEPLVLGEDANINVRVDPAPSIDAPLVFAGYGLNIPERGINDLAGLNLKGAIVVYVAATPKSLPGPLQAHFGSAAERWKMYQAAGAIGTISIANPKSMDIPWARSTLARLQAAMSLADESLQDAPGQKLSVTMNPAHADKLLAGSGHTFAEILALADADQDVPRFPLTARLKATAKVERAQVESQNVAGILQGSDPARRNEYVVLSAHLDHLGVGEPINGDKIYNGAMDNASGVAVILEVAAMLHDSGAKPARSILFVAVTGEEKGELGSRYFAAHSTVPLHSIVANINTDMFLPLFPLKMLMVLGLDESDLGRDIGATAAELGLKVQADPEPQRNRFVRSDQYSFIKSGIPALAMKVGYEEKSPEAAIAAKWTAERYHAPSDDLNQPVDISAAEKFVDVVRNLALRIATRPDKPRWNDNSFFKRFAAAQDVSQLKQMSARFAPIPLRVDVSGLSAGDQKALAKLIEAAKVVDHLFMQELWSGNLALYQKLQPDKSPLGQERLHYFWINKGPWSEIDEHKAFLPGVPAKKPAGANFYPEDMTKEEFESWVKTLPAAQKQQAEGFFTAIRRGPDKKLRLVPYSQEYKTDLDQLAKLLREAADLTSSASLKKFLTTRAAAFTSNNYYESDVAWMDLDAPIDVTIGPYETYNDELFGYKAAFEAYINIRDEKESAKLGFFAQQLQNIENNLPIDPQYRNPKIGALAPIRVVNEAFSAGDGNHGVQTAAYNLPNDEKVVQEKGAKRVMLKNIQEAKFNATLVPISRIVLPAAARPDLNFDLFFTHIVAHEVTHGLGPHQIKIQGRETNPRLELKELYSTIEEAKADITGLFALQYLMTQNDQGRIQSPLPHGPAAERQLYTTYLASSFRTLRFGLQDSHARGMAIQFNYLRDKGAYILNGDGTYSVDFNKIKDAIRSLDHDFLTIEATGDYAGAKKMITELAVVRPEVQRALDRLKSIPTDIEPKF